MTPADEARQPEVARSDGPDAPSDPPGRLRAGFRRGSSGFASEFNAYLQERLRLWAVVMGTAGAALYVALRLSEIRHMGGATPELFLRAASVVHLLGVVYGIVAWRLLRRRRFTARGLRWVDLLNAVVLIGVSVSVYEATYMEGNRLLVAILGLFLVTRAILTPSRALWTFLLCLPAPWAVLAVQLSHGEAYIWNRWRFPEEGFPELVLWDQIFLYLCAAIATVASRVNFRLRLKAYEAKQLDQYVLEELIGKGAMGEVYRARHALMKRPTAIKLVRPEAMSERLLKRFEQEVRLTSRLTHPNTIRIYDYGQTADGTFYYAMELLDGADLERVVLAAGPMPAARVIHLLVQACGALHEAHEMGLVHRDVKPSNLLLCRMGLERDVVKVMDFGLVKDTSADAGLTSAEEVCGSPHTIAPETLTGAKPTARADLYALAAVGCFLLTGKPIFDGTTMMDFVVAHLNKPPIPPSAREPSVPADLEAVLLRCLDKDPARRPATAEALRHELLACAAAGRWSPEDAAGWWESHATTLASRPAVTSSS